MYIVQGSLELRLNAGCTTEPQDRSKGESAVFVVDPETDQLLHYEPVTGYPPTKVAKIPREVLNEHPECEIRYDLIDCSIDICSVEVSSRLPDPFFAIQVISVKYRSRRCSKITSTMVTSEETSSMESSHLTF